MATKFFVAFKNSLLCVLICIISFVVLGCNENDFGSLYVVRTQSLTFLITMESKNAKVAKNAVEEFMVEFEKNFNTKLTDSKISEVNNAPKNFEIEIDKYFYDLFNFSMQVYNLNKNFNPSLFPLIKLWGLDDFENVGGEISCVPTNEKIDEMLPLCKMENFIAKEEGGKFYIKKTVDGAMLDFGAVAKGYACDVAVSILKNCKIEKALVNYAGNLSFFDFKKTRNAKTEFEIRNPGKSNIKIKIKDKESAIVTSGTYERYFMFQGNKISHVLNENGRQGAGEIMSATIINRSGAIADSYATILINLSLDNARTFICENSLKAVLINEHGQVVFNNV